MAKDKGLSLTPIVLGDRGHTAKKVRPHVAQEYRDKGQHEIAEDLVWNLRPWAQDEALGVDRATRSAQGVHHA